MNSGQDLQDTGTNPDEVTGRIIRGPEFDPDQPLRPIRTGFEVEYEGVRFFGQVIKSARVHREIEIEVAARLGRDRKELPGWVQEYEGFCVVLNKAIDATQLPQVLVTYLTDEDTGQPPDWINYPDPDYVVGLYRVYMKVEADYLRLLKKNRKAALHAPAAPRGEPARSVPDSNVELHAGRAD